MRQLTNLDAYFLAAETSRVPQHVSALVILDPSGVPGRTITLEKMTQQVADRLHLVPPFRRRLVEVPLNLDHGYWLDDPDFELDFHIREIAIPASGSAEQLKEQVARIFARPLDRARPLWELYLIHGLDGGRVAMLTKIHHALVDGVSGADGQSDRRRPHDAGQRRGDAGRRRPAGRPSPRWPRGPVAKQAAAGRGATKDRRRPADLVQRRALRTPKAGVHDAAARRRQARQGGVWGHGERRGDGFVRGVDPPVARGTQRARQCGDARGAGATVEAMYPLAGIVDGMD